MTDDEWDTFLQWVQAHTALGRLGHGELQTAFEKAAAAGYAVIKIAPAVAG
jgi:hypothetical protein